MFFRAGLLLCLTAVFLQIAVFLQPLLPVQYQIAPVCETITRALMLKDTVQAEHSVSHHPISLVHDHHASNSEPSTSISHQHDAHHQCQYCTVYGNLVLPPDLDLKEVLESIQVRLIAFQNAFRHVWFVLQQLFLIPQGRAPPLFA